uniref:Uncharacterized protein n=1 Tax=Oryza brachyantha TaxID=4533 RepID=J3LKE5_ORYBR
GLYNFVQEKVAGLQVYSKLKVTRITQRSSVATSLLDSKCPPHKCQAIACTTPNVTDKVRNLDCIHKT